MRVLGGMASQMAQAAHNTRSYIASLFLVSYYKREIVQEIANKESIVARNCLANIAWVCAIFGEYLTQLIQLLYTGLLGVEERPDASRWWRPTQRH
jgi:hypothetical protein